MYINKTITPSFPILTLPHHRILTFSHSHIPTLLITPLRWLRHFKIQLFFM